MKFSHTVILYLVLLYSFRPFFILCMRPRYLQYCRYLIYMNNEYPYTSSLHVHMYYIINCSTRDQHETKTKTHHLTSPLLPNEYISPSPQAPLDTTNLLYRSWLCGGCSGPAQFSVKHNCTLPSPAIGIKAEVPIANTANSHSLQLSHYILGWPKTVSTLSPFPFLPQTILSI